jgi:uncharacterized protein
VILEGIVTTVSPDGALNIAPMGPEIGTDPNLRRIELRPYRSSTTYKNLRWRGEGVFHVTDDVLLLAQSAIGAPIEPEPELRQAQTVTGWILAGACRYFEFRVVDIDDRADRARITVDTLAEGRIRDFLGFNRARHAVLEAAILATRIAILPRAEILLELERLSVLVTKTGGSIEEQAFRLLHEHVLKACEANALNLAAARS